MTRPLNIGPGVQLAPEQAEDVIAILGRRGRGKTNTAVVIVEELDRAGARFCVADPTGVWWGLKSSNDGRAPGIPVVVMGGDHGDVPLEETAGRLLADFVADPTSPSVVLDFRGFRKAQMTRFMADFLEQLYHRNREALHLVLDEADQFAPQRVMGETARLVGAAEDVCKMGRAKGLHPIVITQRPAALNKNVLTQAGLLIAHQLTGPQDQKAVDEWIRANADEKQRDLFMSTIATLERGVAWFWQPDLALFVRCDVRMRKTFDSSATPKRGEKRTQPKAAAEVDLDALKQRIASTIEKAKAEDPRELKRTIAELRAQLVKAQAAKPAPAPKVKTVERAVVKPAEVKRLEVAIDRLERADGSIRKSIDALSQRQQVVVTEAGLLRQQLAAAQAQQGAGVSPARMAPATSARPAPAVSTAAVRDVRNVRHERPASGEGPAATKMGRAFLTCLAQRGRPLQKRQILTLTGYRSTGDVSKMFAALVRDGLAVAPGPGLLQVTPEGVASLGDYTPLPTGVALREHLLATSSKMEAAFLRELFGEYPADISKRSILDRTGYRSTGDVSKTFAKLVVLGYAEKVGTGQLRAAEELFS